MAQVYSIALSPAQRFILFQFSHDEASKIKDREEGKRYRRWAAAFGIDVITKTARLEGKVNGLTATDEETLQLFDITVENAEFATKLFARELPSLFEDLCGDIMDTLEDIVRGRAPTVPDVPQYDAAAESLKWTSKR
jgi:hypothetical protein